MKLIFFAFKHRYRFKDLNNFLYSRLYGKYFLLNLSGPFKHIFAKILIKFSVGTPISLDGRPLINDNNAGVNFFIRGTNLNIPTDLRYLKNNIVSIMHPMLDNKDVFQIYPLNIKKTKMRKDLKIIYMSSINIDANKSVKDLWEKNKKNILSDFTIIDTAEFWYQHFTNYDVEKINSYYRAIKLLLRREIVLYLKNRFKNKFILIGSDWSKISIGSMESNYNVKKNNEMYRGNICLDLGSIEGSSSLYSRSNQIIESGGLVIQTNQFDYKKKWNNLNKKILFKNFTHLENVVQKIFTDYEYSNKLLNEIYDNFSNSYKLTENSLDKVFDHKYKK